MSIRNRLASPRVWFLVFIVVVIVPLLPLLLSGRWDWWEAWAYAILSILGFAISRYLAGRRHPDLLRERARMLQHADAEPWDRVLARLVGLGGALISLVAGLEARFAWSSEFSLGAKVVCLAIIVAGYALGSYALIENRFFSGMVRIQIERGHHVVSSGPYRWVRHPGYAGALLAYLASPFLLDSLWAFYIALLLALGVIIRTELEDKTLQHRLDGYREYADRVRYRLVPGLW